MQDRYCSNDWLTPIVERSRETLVDFTHEEALRITTVLTLEKCLIDTEVPWAIVFPSDDIDEALNRLEATLRIGHGVSLEELTVDERIRYGVHQVKKILGEENAHDGIVGAFAARHVLRAIHGNQGEDCHIYQDNARDYPLYAGRWLQEISDLFGADFPRRLKREHGGLFQILRGDVLAAARFDQRKLQLPGEETHEYIKRAFETAREVGFDELRAMLQKRLTPYRETTYGLRGLEYSFNSM